MMVLKMLAKVPLLLVVRLEVARRLIRSIDLSQGEEGPWGRGLRLDHPLTRTEMFRSDLPLTSHTQPRLMR